MIFAKFSVFGSTTFDSLGFPASNTQKSSPKYSQMNENLINFCEKFRNNVFGGLEAAWVVIFTKEIFVAKI